jgi:hypothetical protein
MSRASRAPAFDPDAPPVTEILDAIHRAARAHAKRWTLICDNGQIICLRDGCGLEATLPSLLCGGHLLAHQRRAGR